MTERTEAGIGRRRALAAVAALAAAGVLGACSLGTGDSRDFVNPAAALPRGATVAVLPFQNLTNHPNAGMITAELVSTELYRQGLFTVMEPSRVRYRLTEAKLDMDSMTDNTYAQKVAQTLGVDGVIVGSTTEYGYQHGLREEPVVGFTARLVRAGDGGVAWGSSQSEVGRGFFTRDSVNEVAQRVVARMLASLRGAAG